jgi:hypothetical protein
MNRDRSWHQALRTAGLEPRKRQLSPGLAAFIVIATAAVAVIVTVLVVRG